MFEPSARSTFGADSHLRRDTGMRAGPGGEVGLIWKKPSQSPLDRQSAAAAAGVEHLATLVMNAVQFKNLDKSYNALTSVVDSLSLLL